MSYFKLTSYRTALIIAIILHIFLMTAYFFYERHHKNDEFYFAGKIIHAYVEIAAPAAKQVHSEKNQHRLQPAPVVSKQKAKLTQPPKKKLATKTSMNQNMKKAASHHAEALEGRANKPPAPALIQLLHQAIQKQQHYPQNAIDAEEEGTATVRFVLFPDGHVEKLTLVHSSGSKQLDQAALAAVHQATPFQGVNKLLTQSSEFQIDVTFALDSDEGEE